MAAKTRSIRGSAHVPEIVGSHFVLGAGEKRLGGLSTVCRGVDTRDLSPVAVKFIVGQSDELTRKVFERESKTLRSLSHPNIVRLRDAGIDDTGTYYLVLDWVEHSLANVLDRQGPWTDWQALYTSIVRPLLDGLAYAHLNQVEHRDIKPANILIGDAGTPLLADFGIAKLGGGDEPHSELTVQAFRSGIYAPPESETPIRYVRDIYSVGVLILRCMSDHAPTDLASLQRALDAAPVSPDVRRLLANCIHADPHERPTSASALAAEFARLHGSEIARQERPRNPIWLLLTQSAQRQLVGEGGDKSRATAACIADLRGDVFGAFQTDRATGQPDRSTVVLCGSEHRFKLKIDGNCFRVIAVQTPELEVLEGTRRHSLKLPPVLDWTVHQPGDSAAAQRATHLLVGLLQDFHDSSLDAEEEPQSAGDDGLFDTWLSILEAREELARGEHEPRTFKAAETRGKRALFTLDEVCEPDLVGTDWEAFDPHTQRAFGRGEVIEQNGDELTLLSYTDFRGLPKRGTLRPYNGPSAVAIRRQRDALGSIRDGSCPGANLRRILIDPAVNAAPAAANVADWELELDETKRSAVAAALGASEALLVQGPPGTGKTSFITETVIQFLRANPRARILIASQTHVAVDNAVERLHSAGVRGLVRLAGANDSAVQPGARDLLLDRQLRTWADSVRRRAEKTLARRAGELGISPRHLEAALALEQVVAVAERIEHVRDHVRALSERGSNASADLVTAVEGEDPRERYQADLENLTNRHRELVESAQRLIAGELTLTTEIDASQARSAIELLLGDDSQVRDLLRLVELQANWLERIGVDNSLTSVFLAGTSVVAGTCTGFLRLPAAAQLEFDLCIVDEASKATLTEAVVPMSRAKRWVLVGDTNQLPPSDEDLLRNTHLLEANNLTKQQVTETLFQRLVDHLPPESTMMLTEQYRMVRPIGDLISTCFYQGKLRSPREDGLSGFAQVVGASVTWFDTSALGDSRREHAAGTSRANRAEARLIADQLVTIDHAIDFGVIKPKSPTRLEVLVIAPYKSQVEELRRRVAPLRLKNLEVDVMSVDAVQGRESDLALLSVTRSNEQGELGFLGADYWRRINVALSRARFGLVIVGDADFIRDGRGALADVLTYINEHPIDCTVKLASND